MYAYYNDMLGSLLVLADALPAQMSDKRLIELSRSVAITAELDRLAAFQLNIVARGLVYQNLSDREMLTLARWIGSEDIQAEALNNLEPAVTLYGVIGIQSWADIATTIRQTVLDSQGQLDSLPGEAIRWSDAQSRRLAALRDMVTRLAAELDLRAAALGTAARNRTAVTGALTAATVIATLVGASLLAVRISRRLRRTRHAALTAARVELPSAIANVIACPAMPTRCAPRCPSRPTRIDAMLDPGAGRDRRAGRGVRRRAPPGAAPRRRPGAAAHGGPGDVRRAVPARADAGPTADPPDRRVRPRRGRPGRAVAPVRPRPPGRPHAPQRGEPARPRRRRAGPVDHHGRSRSSTCSAPPRRRSRSTAGSTVAEAPPVAVAAHVAGDAIHLLAELLENATSFSPPHADGPGLRAPRRSTG